MGGKTRRPTALGHIGAGPNGKDEARMVQCKGSAKRDKTYSENASVRGTECMQGQEQHRYFLKSWNPSQLWAASLTVTCSRLIPLTLVPLTFFLIFQPGALLPGKPHTTESVYFLVPCAEVPIHRGALTTMLDAVDCNGRERRFIATWLEAHVLSSCTSVCGYYPLDGTHSRGGKLHCL